MKSGRMGSQKGRVGYRPLLSIWAGAVVAIVVAVLPALSAAAGKPVVLFDEGHGQQFLANLRLLIRQIPNNLDFNQLLLRLIRLAAHFRIPQISQFLALVVQYLFLAYNKLLDDRV